MDVLETAVTFPFWNATVWYPPPGLGTTTARCTMRHGRSLGRPLGGSGRLDGALADGGGEALGAGAGEDEPVAATATPAPVSTPTPITPAMTATRREPSQAARRP